MFPCACCMQALKNFAIFCWCAHKVPCFLDLAFAKRVNLRHRQGQRSCEPWHPIVAWRKTLTGPPRVEARSATTLRTEQGRRAAILRSPKYRVVLVEVQSQGPVPCGRQYRRTGLSSPTLSGQDPRVSVLVELRSKIRVPGRKGWGHFRR